MIFRGKKVEQKEKGSVREEEPDFKIIISPNGKQVEFIDNVYHPNAISGEPNVTRLVFGQPYAVNGQRIATDGQRFSGLPEQTNKGIQPLYHAKVSWYKEGETIHFDEDGKDVSRREAYTDVVLGVDIAKINRKDMEYCKKLFVELLDRSRVDQYKFTGLLVDPIHDDSGIGKRVKCGNYIGSVRELKNGIYTKYYNGIVGEMVHDSPEMVEKRRIHYENVIDSLDRADEEDQQEIMRLQKKISAREPRRQKAKQALNIINGKDEPER